MKKLLFICLITCFSQLNAQVCFKTPQVFTPSGASPKTIKNADFDNNGIPDFITVNCSTVVSAGITVMMNYNAGTTNFASNTTYALTFSTTPTDVAVGDFDTDGLQDIVIVNNGSANVSVMPGLGNGTFGSAINFNVGTGPKSIVIEDFNADTKLDIAVVNTTGNSISILTNTSSGTGVFTFTNSSTLTGLTSPLTIASADFNLDNKPDLALLSSSGSNVTVFLNTGSAFSALVNYVTGSSPGSITLGDFDGVNGVDIATVSNSSSSLSVLLNTGSGTFGTVTGFSSSTNYLEGINNADFDLDGKLDIAAIGYGTSSGPFVFHGNGNGTFAAGVQIVNVSTSSGTIPLIKGDYSLDGIPDLTYLLPGSNSVDILINAKPKISGITSICAGGSTILTATNATSFLWSTGGNNDTIHANNLATTTVYTVTGTTGSCSAATTSTVTVMALPTLNISGSTTICSGNSATLTGNGATTYSWSTGSTNVNLTVTPAVTTQYTLSGTNANGCTNTVTTIVTVNASPAPSASSNGSICAAQLLSFSTAFTGATAYAWSGPNGFSSSLQNPTITNATPAASGTYTLTVVNANGCSGIAYTNALVNANPTITVNNGTICGGNVLTLTAGGATTYTWAPTTNLSGVNSQSPNVTPTTTTDYTVTGTDANGCVNNAVAIVTVNATAVIAVNSPTICYGIKANLTTTITTVGTPPYIYSWGNGATTFSTTVFPLTNTQYNVSLTDANGCTSSSVASVTVLSNDDISGTIYDTTTVSGVHPIIAGLVYLYPEQGSSTAIDTTNLLTGVVHTTITNPTGVYTFSQIPAGNYYLKAEANITNYSGSVATYLSTRQNKAYRWDSATVVTHVGCGNGTDAGHDISIIELPALTGIGVISGTITAAPSFGGRYASGGHNQIYGSPLKGVDVKLGKSPGGGCSARTTADTSGAYSFTGVDTGRYSIYVDIPNYGMITILTTTISPTNLQSLNNNYCVDSINVNICTSSVGIKQNVNNSYNVNIYPNPNNGIFNLQVAEHENMSVEVYSVIGQKVYTETLHNELQSLNISSLNDGVYLVRVIKNNSVVYQTKICKQ